MGILFFTCGAAGSDADTAALGRLGVMRMLFFKAGAAGSDADTAALGIDLPLTLDVGLSFVMVDLVAFLVRALAFKGGD